MTESLRLTTSNAKSAYAFILSGWKMAKHIIAEGKSVEIIIRESSDEKTLRANRFYWAYVLKYISLYLRTPDGSQHSEKTWHTYFKEHCLGYEFQMVQVPGRKKRKVARVIRSTSDLNSRQFSNYIERIFSLTSCDYGLTWDQDIALSLKKIINTGTNNIVDPESGQRIMGI